MEDGSTTGLTTLVSKPLVRARVHVIEPETKGEERYRENGSERRGAKRLEQDQKGLRTARENFSFIFFFFFSETREESNKIGAGT